MERYGTVSQKTLVMCSLHLAIPVLQGGQERTREPSESSSLSQSAKIDEGDGGFEGERKGRHRAAHTRGREGHPKRKKKGERTA